uniref:TolC family protein n=1 Tax=Trichocoleus desertorum TaxID=1481672 RepID=UPI0025B2B239|nr:TolC family protein [Trichocoleus desertorum]
MQTIRYLMAVGVSAAIALGSTLGTPEPSAAQSKPSAQPSTDATPKSAAKTDATVSDSTFEQTTKTSSDSSDATTSGSKRVTKASSSRSTRSSHSANQSAANTSATSKSAGQTGLTSQDKAQNDSVQKDSAPKDPVLKNTTRPKTKSSRKIRSTPSSEKITVSGVKAALKEIAQEEAAQKATPQPNSSRSKDKTQAESEVQPSATPKRAEKPAEKRIDKTTAPAKKTAQTSAPLPTLEPANPSGSEAPRSPQPVQPNSSSPTLPVTPTATPTTPAGNPTPSIRPVPRGYLNPDPNPLRFPTRPSEVEIQGTQPITLQEAVALAERNTPSLQVARLTLERSRAALREAQAAYYPDVTAQANITHQDSNQANISQQPQFDDGDTASTSLSGTVGVSYDIFTSGRRSATIRAAEKQVRSNELEVEAQREQLRLDVTNNYYDLQQSDEQVRISRAAVETAQASLRDALALERAGVGTRFDVLRFQVDLANSQQDLTQALSDQRTARRQLAQRLNVIQSIDLSSADPVEIAGLWNLSLEQSIVQAFKNRAELEQQLLQREVNEQQRRIALSENRPQVSAFLNTSLQDQFDDDRDALRSYSLGARVNWNLFDGGAARARARQEEIDAEISETQFADTRNQVRLDVERSFFNLQSNFENIQTASVALEQARESLRLARLRFQAGVGTQTDVISAQNELTRAEGNRLNAILNYNRALATLQRSITNLGAAPISPVGTTPAATAP